MTAPVRISRWASAPRVVAVVVGHLDPAVELAHDLSVLRLGLLAVDAERDDDLDVPVPDPGGVQPGHQKRQIDFASRGAGHVRGDDHHLVAGTEPGQRIGAVVQRPLDQLDRGTGRLPDPGPEHREEMLGRDFQRIAFLAALEIDHGGYLTFSGFIAQQFRPNERRVWLCLAHAPDK